MEDKIRNLFGIYHDVEKDLKFLVKSDGRVKILISLNEGSKNLAQLKKEFNLSSSTILHGMYQLEQKNIIIRDSGNYHLSWTGKIFSDKLMDMIKSIYALETCETILLNHDIGCIPTVLLKDLGCLKDSKMVKSISTDIMRPHNVLSGFLSQSDKVKHLSSVLFTPNIQLFFADLDKNRDIHLLLTREIMDTVLERVDMEILEKGLAKGNLKLGVIDDDAKISFTLSDDFMALGLYSIDGTYDLNAFLMSGSKEAISWGERLFEYYQDLSTDFNSVRI